MCPRDLRQLRVRVLFCAGNRYSNYTSNERFRTEMRKHDRQKFGPHDKCAPPPLVHQRAFLCA